MKNTLFIILITLLITISTPTQSRTSHLEGHGIVHRVVDGDTFDIQVDRRVLERLIQSRIVSTEHINMRTNTFRVRLANIDTEESVHSDSSRNTQRGEDTSYFVRNLLSSQNIDFECYEAGRYGRAICSISFNQGDLGQYLIKNGYSDYITQWGNHPTQHLQYRRAQVQYNYNRARNFINNR